jgi:hypothetical protein
MSDDEIRTMVAKCLNVLKERLRVFAIEREEDGSIRLVESSGTSVLGTDDCVFDQTL